MRSPQQHGGPLIGGAFSFGRRRRQPRRPDHRRGRAAARLEPVEADENENISWDEEEGAEERGAAPFELGDQEAGASTRSGFVAIVGKPNVGKSTLLNTMLGVKVAPITPKPQTTRRGVRGIYTQDDRQLVFVDTPGLHRGGETVLDQTMDREVRDAVVDVDVVLWVVDLSRPPSDEDKDVARLLGALPPDTP